MKNILYKFNTEKHGYNKREVDSFIEKQETSFESTRAELKNKINDLTNQIISLKNELEQLKIKETSIADALLSAGEKAREQELLAYKKLQMEETRLAVFQKKWTSFIETQTSSKDVLAKKYIIDEYLKGAREELLEELNKHFTYLYPKTPEEAQFISESKRLAKLNREKVFD